MVVLGQMSIVHFLHASTISSLRSRRSLPFRADLNDSSIVSCLKGILFGYFLLQISIIFLSTLTTLATFSHTTLLKINNFVFYNIWIPYFYLFFSSNRLNYFCSIWNAKFHNFLTVKLLNLSYQVQHCAIIEK